MRSTRQQGLAIGLAGTPRNARARSTRKHSNGRRGRGMPRARLLAFGPLRPSRLRGETVSVFRGLTRVLRGYFGNPLLRLASRFL
jgi:hypothetical protein